jgi:hypothetical protein
MEEVLENTVIFDIIKQRVMENNKISSYQKDSINEVLTNILNILEKNK